MYECTADHLFVHVPPNLIVCSLWVPLPSHRQPLPCSASGIGLMPHCCMALRLQAFPQAYAGPRERDLVAFSGWCCARGPLKSCRQRRWPGSCGSPLWGKLPAVVRAALAPPLLVVAEEVVAFAPLVVEAPLVVDGCCASSACLSSEQAFWEGCADVDCRDQVCGGCCDLYARSRLQQRRASLEIAPDGRPPSGLPREMCAASVPLPLAATGRWQARADEPWMRCLER